jgi:hypothetical protein
MGARAGGSILRHAAAAGLACAILTVALAWTGWGREAGLSALAGSLVVLVVLLVGLLGISVVVAGDAGLSMAGAAVVYIGQIILIVAALLVLRDRDWLDGRAFAIAAVVQVLVMQVAQVVGYNRGRHAVDAPLAREGDRS